ncbi:hypothetical protein GGQ68_004068 [Sagittula marina]|uniref:Transposase n=1 Tax=Sagittula marina TaxID=943940 RepID=A0A7W6DR65_9RHOB|nr:hypothetical protein [Sagittula marina]
MNEAFLMKKTRLTEAQIMSVLRQIECRVPAAELKRMYADVSMQNDLLKEAFGKKSLGQRTAARWPRERSQRKASLSRWRFGHSSARPAAATSRNSMIITSRLTTCHSG